MLGEIMFTIRDIFKTDDSPPPSTIEKKRRKTRWNLEMRCIDCEEELTSNQEMYSDGICPHCGYDSYSTICKTVRKSIRYVDGVREERINND